MSCFGVPALTPTKIEYMVFTRLLKHLLNLGSGGQAVVIGHYEFQASAYKMSTDPLVDGSGKDAELLLSIGC